MPFFTSIGSIAVEPRAASYGFLALLFIVLPWLSSRTHKSGQVLTMPRSALYVSVALTQWLVVPLLLLTLWLEGRGIESLGLASFGGGGDPGDALTSIRGPGDVLYWAGLVVGVSTILSFILWLLRRGLRLSESDTIRHLIPRTGRERLLFCLLVSTTAGIVEEVLYRGFAVSRLAALLGDQPAAILTAVAFSLGHVYQGAVGVLRAGLIGYVLALPFLITGSLLPSIVAHVAIDMLSGGLLGWTFLDGDTDEPELAPPAVAADPGPPLP